MPRALRQVPVRPEIARKPPSRGPPHVTRTVGDPCDDGAHRAGGTGLKPVSTPVGNYPDRVIEPGPLLAAGRDADIFEYGSGLVLRRSREGRSMAREAQVMEYVRSQGFPVPAVEEVSDDGLQHGHRTHRGSRHGGNDEKTPMGDPTPGAGARRSPSSASRAGGSRLVTRCPGRSWRSSPPSRPPSNECDDEPARAGCHRLDRMHAGVIPPTMSHSHGSSWRRAKCRPVGSWA